MKRRYFFMPLALSVVFGTIGLAQTAPRSTTASQAGEYRQSSANNGTTINSSNTTNYNSNNVTNAPTGVGSNPAAPTTTSPVPPGKSKSASTVSDTGSATNMAIDKARTSPTPAVVAGSTERNSSIHDFVASSPNYITLQNALQSVGLFETLKETKPYTLFAPTNEAFKKLPATMQSGLLEGRNRTELTRLLSYHLVKGAYSTEDLRKRLKAGGTMQLKTVAGEPLTIASGTDGRLTITDQAGRQVPIAEPDRKQNNGYVHGINAVLLMTGDAAGFR